MALTMIAPASSWFEVVELPLIIWLMTKKVNGKEGITEEEISNKSSDQIRRLVNKFSLCRYPRCWYLIYDNRSEFKLHFETLCDSISKLLNKISQFLLCTKWIDEGLFDCRGLHHSKVATGRRKHLPGGSVSSFGNNPARQMSSWIASNRLRV